ncbi:TRAP transporter substrate-binding protein [Thermodesulfobacteriota bacterium]
MKKRKVMGHLNGIFIILVLVALSFMTAYAERAAAAAPEKVWNLRYAAGGAPPVTPFAKSKNVWAKMVEEATHGRVKITPYHSQTLTPLKATWGAVSSGTADIGQAMTGYFPGQFPLTDVMTLPFVGGPSATDNGRVMWQLYNEFPSIRAEYKGVKLLGFLATEAYPLATTKKPVRNLEDLKGLKIRSSGGGIAMTRALGAIPVSIPMPGLYLALQKGVVDGMWYSHESIVGFRQYEVTKYVTDVPSSCVIFWDIINLDTWNEFPPDIQKQIMSVCGEQSAVHYGGKVFDKMKETLSSRLKKQNISWPEKMITLSPAENRRWVETAGKPIRDAWVEKWKDKGPTQKILDRALELVAKFSGR